MVHCQSFATCLRARVGKTRTLIGGLLHPLPPRCQASLLQSQSRSAGHIRGLACGLVHVVEATGCTVFVKCAAWSATGDWVDRGLEQHLLIRAGSLAP